MTDHKAVRQFLKDEAVKKFNGDYDILFNYISDKRVGNSTLRNLIKSYYADDSDLTALELNVPSLTIFVPSLPEDSLSANSWNVSNDIPLVAIRLHDKDKTPLISSSGRSMLLEHNVIPSFPVIVLKENERIVPSNYPQYSKMRDQEYFGNNGFAFRFSLPIFDFINPITIVLGDTPPHVVDAWNIYGQENNFGWHRDYIYYTLQPSNPDGPYLNDYSEFLRDFKLEGTGEQALGYVAQVPSVDPNNLDDSGLINVLVNPSNFNQGSFWTDGDFEFDINTYTEKGVDALQNGFFANPTDLFDIDYGLYQWSSPFTPDYDFYYITNIDTKVYNMSQEITAWQIHEISNRWTFEFQEVDLAVDAEQTVTHGMKRNANFGFEDGELWKFGLELGGELELTESDEQKRSWKLESNDLRQTQTFFADNIIIGENQQGVFFWNFKWYDLRRYSTGRCSFSLMPLKVQ